MRSCRYLVHNTSHDLRDQVVVTDYPDKSLIEMITENVDHNVPQPQREHIHVAVSLIIERGKGNHGMRVRLCQ